ncbi:MAG: hypothetical protein ACRC7W_06675, partial [Fusobacteriaceae bacterium]
MTKSNLNFKPSPKMTSTLKGVGALLISISSLISAYNSNENLVKTDTSNTSMQQIDVKVSSIDVKLNSIN